MNSADFDDDPVRPTMSEPALPADAAARADYGEPARYVDPPPRPGFGFWMAVLWSVLYVIVSQIVVGVAAFVVILLLLAVLGGGLPEDFNGWMQGPTGRVAMLTVVSATQFGGLALSLLLLRLVCGKSWKRKIALTRLPNPTHVALVAIGFPAMIALSVAIEVPLTRYVPSLGEILKDLGVPFDMKGSGEAVTEMVQHAPWALAIFAVAVSPGICEEVFCRGFLAQGLSGRYQTWAVVLIVSFLFGAIHLDPQQGIGAMLLGAAIHGAYLATRSLVVPMAIHFANNGLSVTHVSDSLWPVLTVWEEPFKREPLLFTLAGLVLFGAVVYALYQTRCRLAPAVEGLQGWQPDGVSDGVELPPPNSGTVVTREPLSPVSAALVATGALGFGVMLVLA
jgi:uncharacterized protein